VTLLSSSTPRFFFIVLPTRTKRIILRMPVARARATSTGTTFPQPPLYPSFILRGSTFPSPTLTSRASIASSGLHCTLVGVSPPIPQRKEVLFLALSDTPRCSPPLTFWNGKFSSLYPTSSWTIYIPSNKLVSCFMSLYGPLFCFHLVPK